MTPEEVAKIETAGDDLIARVLVARALIVGDAGGKRGVAGAIECPSCKGRLRYSIASNGHVWASCSTSGCLRWIE